MVRRFAHAGRPGAYLRITREGELGAGDPVEILTRPDHGITIAIVARAIISDDGLLAGAASAPAPPPALAAWMRERAESVGNREMKPPQPTASDAPDCWFSMRPSHKRIALSAAHNHEHALT